MYTLKLSKEVIQFLIRALDKTPVQGPGAARLLIDVSEGLKKALNQGEQHVVSETKEEAKEKKEKKDKKKINV